MPVDAKLARAICRKGRSVSTAVAPPFDAIAATTMAEMNSLDYWRLCNEVSVVQAALLLVGIDPSSEVGSHCDELPTHQQPEGYMAVKTALANAVRSGDLIAVIRHAAREVGEAEVQAAVDLCEIRDDTSSIGPRLEDVLDEDEVLDATGFIYKPTPDWNLTTVNVAALRDWLSGRGFKTGFFFSEESGAPAYLDPKHPRYAPKLAAAVSAWLDVEDPKGKSPKQALVKWLRENAATFDLSDDDGKPNEQGIDECAKVANWQPGGGAPRTPGT